MKVFDTDLLWLQILMLCYLIIYQYFIESYFPFNPLHFLINWLSHEILQQAYFSLKFSPTLTILLSTHVVSFGLSFCWWQPWWHLGRIPVRWGWMRGVPGTVSLSQFSFVPIKKLLWSFRTGAQFNGLCVHSYRGFWCLCVDISGWKLMWDSVDYCECLMYKQIS